MSARNLFAKLLGPKRPAEQPPAWVVHFYNAMAAQLKEMQMDLDQLKTKADALQASIESETDLDTVVAQLIADKDATIADLRTQLAAAVPNSSVPQRMATRTPTSQRRDDESPERLRKKIEELEEEILQLRRVNMPEIVYPPKWLLTGTESRLLTLFFTSPSGFRSYESLESFFHQRAFKLDIDTEGTLSVKMHTLKQKVMDHGVSFTAKSGDGIQMLGRERLADHIRNQMRSWLELLMGLHTENRRDDMRQKTRKQRATKNGSQGNDSNVWRRAAADDFLV